MNTTTEESVRQDEIQKGFVALCVKYRWPWLHQVAAAPRDPSTRALVLASIHVYPPENFTPEQLEKLIAESPVKCFADAPTTAPHTLATRPARTTSVTGGDVPVRLERDMNYRQYMTDRERATMEIEGDVLEELIEAALDDDEHDFEDALMNQLEEHVTENESDYSWESYDTDYGDTTERSSENLEVSRQSRFRAWAEERLAEYRITHPLPPEDEDEDDE